MAHVAHEVEQQVKPDAAGNATTGVRPCLTAGGSDDADEDEQKAANKETDAQDVVTMTQAEVLEFQRKHGDFADEQEAEHQFESEEEGGVEHGGCEIGLATGDEGSPEYGARRSGHSDETGMLTLVDVEFCETIG